MASTISAGTTTATAMVYTADTSGVLQLASNNGTTAITVDTSQNVGIGTGAPGNRLHLYKANGSENKLIIENASTSQSSTLSLITQAATPGGCYIYMGKSGATTNGQILYDPNNDAMELFTGSTERLRIDSSGNVGIGTSSPGSKLDVTNGGIQITTAGYNLSILGGPSGTLGGVLMRSVPRITVDNGTFENTYIGCGATVGSIIFQQGSSTTTSSNTERMRIDSSGNVGIGTSSPSGKLHVTAAAGSQTVAYFGNQTSGARTDIQIYSASNSDGFIWFARSGGSENGAIRYNHSSDYMSFQTNSAERMRIDSSGNLGIGTSSPNYKLNVGSTSSVTTLNGVGLTLFTSGSLTSNIGGVLNFRAGLGQTASDIFNLSICAYDHSGDTNADGLSINGYDGISFCTGGNSRNERMRIDSSGNLLVGTTSQLSGEKLGVLSSAANQMVYFRNSNATPGGIFVNYSVATPNNTGSEFLFCNDPAQTRMTVRSNGGIANYSGNNVNLSDRREKTNFAPAKPYLDVICAIPVQTFNYIDQNTEEDPGLTLGVVAQDVQAVAPELVMESDWSSERDGSKMRLSIYQTDLQYALMKAIQELKAEFDAYKASHP